MLLLFVRSLVRIYVQTLTNKYFNLFRRCGSIRNIVFTMEIVYVIVLKE